MSRDAMVDAGRAFGAAVKVAARAHRMPVARVLAPQGSREARTVRQLAAYVATMACGVPVLHVAAEVGVYHNSLREGFARIEDHRDCPRFDRLVSRLERDVRRMAGVNDEEIAA